MDVAKAFTFVPEDEQWVGKIGIGALITLLSFLIIPIPLLVGYMVGVARNVMNGVPQPLPVWEDWGQLFKDGLAIIVALLVYTLPFWLLACFAGVATVGFGGMAEANEDAAAAGMMATFGLAGCLMFLFWLALFFLSPAIFVQYIRAGELGATFRFGEVAAIARDNIGHILVVFLVTLGVNFVLGLILGVISIIPCIGWIISFIVSMAAGPYLAVATGHMYGQIAVS